ncbi:regulatory protein RecX [Saccharopolyspora sp. NFXS83]|uniref:regulatory protein RecX n=1 Tax=Saccharopolyspora sp. NFXS83 TaxID=2993560 RepID=UPI003A4D6440
MWRSTDHAPGSPGAGAGLSSSEAETATTRAAAETAEPDGSAARGTGKRRRRSAMSESSESPESSAARSSGRTGKRRQRDECPPGVPQSPEASARDVVYRMLAVRARSRAELRQALLRKEIDEDVADAVLQKFVDAGLVDDAEFAEAWVSERQRNQGLGRKALGYELRRKGVEEHLVAEALSTVDADAEEERARELVRRKLRSITVDDPEKRLRRLVGMLARKGYPEGMAFRVVKDELDRSELEAGAEDPEMP